MHPINERRQEQGVCHNLVQELRADPERHANISIRYCVCAMAEPYGAAYMMTYNLVIIPLWYTLLHINTFFLSLGINTVMLLLCWIQ